jgi:uncharacterized phage protein (TIGR01671 family)
MRLVMEDRFKFRAWYAKDKEMIYFDFDLLNEESRAFYKESIEKSDKMQSTGLKDKNGKLIYEGDIIVNGDTHGEEEEVIHECVFSEGAFVFDPFPKGNREGPLIGYEEFLHSLEDLREKGECVIKGNKYEHPELLTEEEPLVFKFPADDTGTFTEIYTDEKGVRRNYETGAALTEEDE